MNDSPAGKRRRFNPRQVRIDGFASVLREPEAFGQPPKFDLEVRLLLDEARAGGVAIQGVTIRATSPSIETMEQGEVVDMLLDILTGALARERAGIRHGMPSPEGTVPPLGHRGSRDQEAGDTSAPNPPQTRPDTDQE